jgi:hypothetical protein
LKRWVAAPQANLCFACEDGLFEFVLWEEHFFR